MKSAMRSLVGWLGCGLLLWLAFDTCVAQPTTRDSRKPAKATTRFAGGLRTEFLRLKAAEYGKMLDDPDQDKRKEAIDFFHDMKALDVLCSQLAESAIGSQLTKEYAVAAIDDIVQPGDAVVAEHLLNALKSPVQVTGGLAVAAWGWSYRTAVIKAIEHVTGLELPKAQDVDTMEANLPKIFPVVEKWLAERPSADARPRATTGAWGN